MEASAFCRTELEEIAIVKFLCGGKTILNASRSIVSGAPDVTQKTAAGSPPIIDVSVIEYEEAFPRGVKSKGSAVIGSIYR